MGVGVGGMHSSPKIKKENGGLLIRETEPYFNKLRRLREFSRAGRWPSMIPVSLWCFSEAFVFLCKVSLPSVWFQKEDLKAELQPAMSVENKTKPVVPDKIGELRSGSWVPPFSVKGLEALPVMDKHPWILCAWLLAEACAASLPWWHLHLQRRSVRPIWRPLSSPVALIITVQELAGCWARLLSRELNCWAGSNENGLLFWGASAFPSSG